MITKQTGLDGYDGILGLGPANESQNGPSFVKTLYQQGKIDAEILTFVLEDYNDSGLESTVEIGGRPADLDYYTLDLIEQLDYWWSVTMTAINYGDDSIQSSNINYTIIDSGSSLIVLETQDYYNFVDQIKLDVPTLDCTQQYCYTLYETCDQIAPSMKSLEFKLGNLHFSLPPNAYMFSGDNENLPLCNIAISSMDDVMILGDTFMRNFVTSFDYSTDVISLVANTNAPSGVVISETHVSNSGGMSGFAIFVVIFVVLLVLVVSAWIGYKYWTKRNMKKTLSAVAYEQSGSVRIDGDITEGTPRKNSYYKQHWSAPKQSEDPLL